MPSKFEENIGLTKEHFDDKLSRDDGASLGNVFKECVNFITELFKKDTNQAPKNPVQSPLKEGEPKGPYGV